MILIYFSAMQNCTNNSLKQSKFKGDIYQGSLIEQSLTQHTTRAGQSKV